MYSSCYFFLHLPLLYGEGGNAFRWLLEELIRTDQTLFAYSNNGGEAPEGPIGSIPVGLVGMPRISGIFSGAHYLQPHSKTCPLKNPGAAEQPGAISP